MMTFSKVTQKRKHMNIVYEVQENRHKNFFLLTEWYQISSLFQLRERSRPSVSRDGRSRRYHEYSRHAGMSPLFRNLHTSLTIYRKGGEKERERERERQGEREREKEREKKNTCRYIKRVSIEYCTSSWDQPFRVFLRNIEFHEDEHAIGVRRHAAVTSDDP